MKGLSNDDENALSSASWGTAKFMAWSIGEEGHSNSAKEAAEDWYSSHL